MNIKKSFLHQRVFHYFLIASVSAVFVILSFVSGMFQGTENFFEDILFTNKQFDSQIVIVSIDDESIQKIGQWPWPRAVFAKAFSHLEKYNPTAVGVDVVFSEESRSGADDDLILARTLASLNYPVVMPVEGINVDLNTVSHLQTERILMPRDIFTHPSTITLGHVNLVRDRDGVIRRFPSTIASVSSLETNAFHSFAEEVSILARPDLKPIEDLDRTPRIVYAGKPGSIRRVPFWRIVEGDIINFPKDSIILIGSTAADLHDESPVPVGQGAGMPGVEIQANIVNMLLSNYRLTQVTSFYMVMWIFFVSFLPAFLIIFFQRSLIPLIISFCCWIVLLVIIILLFQNGIVINIIHSSLAIFLSAFSLFFYQYSRGERERQDLKRAFSKYVSDEVLDEIMKNPSKISLGGEERNVTVFFSDIRSFTTLSENTTPKELCRILNQYFTVMTDEIMYRGGVVDKYIGDAIMAFWGAPLDDDDQADHAVEACLAMSRALERLNKKSRVVGDPPISIGMGLHYGPAIVGNIGSERRFDYTVIGDTVNAASRLEGQTKEYKVQIIISESVRKMLKKDYNLKPLGLVHVKGRAEAIEIFSVEA